MTIHKTQDPKYGIKNNKIVNARTGVPIPDDEPVFILRGKDKYAAGAIEQYLSMVKSVSHADAVSQRFDEFSDFAQANKTRMGEPTTHLCERNPPKINTP